MSIDFAIFIYMLGTLGIIAALLSIYDAIVSNRETEEIRRRLKDVR